MYLMLYPHSVLQDLLAADADLLRAIWKRLSQIGPNQLIEEGRVYEGGLHKMEPGELGNLSADALVDLVGTSARSQTEMFAR